MKNTKLLLEDIAKNIAGVEAQIQGSIVQLNQLKLFKKNLAETITNR